MELVIKFTVVAVLFAIVYTFVHLVSRERKQQPIPMDWKHEFQVDSSNMPRR